MIRFAGRPRTTEARIPFDYLGERRVRVSFEVHGSACASDGRVPVASSVGGGPRAGGSRSSSRFPLTVVLGGISAGRHLTPTVADPGPGWWPGVVGPGKALDPVRRQLVGIDFLGGPSGEETLRPVTTRDQARAVAAVLDELGEARAEVVGASYGGMVALAFAELFPERVSRLVVLCAAHRTHPMATALRSLQRAALRLGVQAGREAEGLSLARALAMTTYRSAAEFEERFSSRAKAGAEDGRPGGRGKERRPAEPRFPVEDYLEARGAAFADQFHPERFLALSESVDLHWTRPASLPAGTLLVSVDSDAIAPPWLVERLAAPAGERRASHVVLSSPFGHDAFLKEVEQVSALVRRGLGEVEARAGASVRTAEEAAR